MSGRIRFGWVGLLTRILLLSGSFASVAGASLSLIPPPYDIPKWGVVALTLAGVLFVLLVVLEFNSYQPYRVFRQGNDRAIGRYMYKWIKRGGRVAVWSRDMSWANNERMYDLLEEKAGAGNLILCISQPICLSQKLSAAGAEVYVYGDWLTQGISRFTIANFERDGSSVAVGRAVRHSHVIEEFQEGHHPAYHIAADLVKLVRALHVPGKNAGLSP